MTQDVFPRSRIALWPIVQRLQSLANDFEAFADEQAEKFPFEVAVLLSHCQVRLLTLSEFVAADHRRKFVEEELAALHDYLDVVRICARLNTWTQSGSPPLAAMFNSHC